MILKAESEIWLPLPSDGRYIVSNKGNIISNCRQPERNIKQWIGSHGYRCVGVGRDNVRTVHSLVAETFIGPANGRQINHKDGNKLNNDLENLEYVSQKENLSHAFSNGLINNKGQNHGRTKFTNLQVTVIREAIQAGHKQSNISRYFKSTSQTINGIKKLRSFKP